MATNVSTDEELQVLLESLGETPAEVGRSLRAAGVKGRRERADACPVANWLVAETGADEIEVDVDGVNAGFFPTSPDGSPAGHLWYRLGVWPPEAVRLFITRFDEGHFQDLEEPDAD